MLCTPVETLSRCSGRCSPRAVSGVSACVWPSLPLSLSLVFRVLRRATGMRKRRRRGTSGCRQGLYDFHCVGCVGAPDFFSPLRFRPVLGSCRETSTALQPSGGGWKDYSRRKSGSKKDSAGGRKKKLLLISACFFVVFCQCVSLVLF